MVVSRHTERARCRLPWTFTMFDKADGKERFSVIWNRLAMGPLQPLTISDSSPRDWVVGLHLCVRRSMRNSNEGDDKKRSVSSIVPSTRSQCGVLNDLLSARSVMNFPGCFSIHVLCLVSSAFSYGFPFPYRWTARYFPSDAFYEALVLGIDIRPRGSARAPFWKAGRLGGTAGGSRRGTERG